MVRKYNTAADSVYAIAIAYTATPSQRRVAARISNLGRLTALSYRRAPPRVRPPVRGRSTAGRSNRRWLLRGRFACPWDEAAPMVQVGNFGRVVAAGRAEATPRIAERNAQVELHLGRDIQQRVDPLQHLSVQRRRHRADAECPRGQHQVLHRRNDGARLA